ncbi:unnamed protein product [Peronospora belbahrii]|uniref:Ribosomal protein L20 n=1 Tax=Peronospora belbahrii TaxID=622444 RepID=A0AAU9KL27_9STRA|nr:unnamed protein product [Peronospora belbahrii]
MSYEVPIKKLPTKHSDNGKKETKKVNVTWSRLLKRIGNKLEKLAELKVRFSIHTMYQKRCLMRQFATKQAKLV